MDCCSSLAVKYDSYYLSTGAFFAKVEATTAKFNMKIKNKL